ncbi:MAG: MotA/TolQ/ExbB proton channel family protein, partial [Myxococcota bacterium]
GISQALITTQLGLAVAIPALLLNAALHSWARSMFADIEEHCIALLHRLEDALPAHSLFHDPDTHRTLEVRHHD